MPTRIPASERASQKLEELLTQGVTDGDAWADLLKLVVRKIVEEALEAEVAEAVGVATTRAAPRPAPATALLAVTDGAPGLIRAVETCFPRALRPRCLVHRLRNLRSKAPESQWPEIAIRARACYEAASPALAALLRDNFVQAYGRDLPAVVQCFLDDFEACIAHLRFPLRHRKVIRTTNLLERLFLEERRRAKIIPHTFGERAGLEADVRRGHPGGRSMARPHGRRVRATATPRDSRRTRPGSR